MTRHLQSINIEKYPIRMFPCSIFENNMILSCTSTTRLEFLSRYRGSFFVYFGLSEIANNVILSSAYVNNFLENILNQN